eukprot:1927180-Heterocapsa_arctica.AAC.1
MPEVPPGPRAHGRGPGGGSQAPTHGRRAGVRADDDEIGLDGARDESAQDMDRDGYASMGLGSRNGEGR